MTTETEPDGFDFKEWYARNGRKLNTSRRSRYKDDPAYRDRVLELNRQSREKRRKRQLAEYAAEASAKKIEPRDEPWKTVRVSLKEGKQEITAELFTIGALARALGVSVQAIRLWERQGVLPPTPLRNKKGDRLYTQQYLETAQAVRESQGKLPTGVRSGFKPLRWMGTFKAGKKAHVNVVVYSISSLAQAIDRTVVTVEQMEQKRYLPETPFRAKNTGYRLYTADMIAAVKDALDARGGTIRGEAHWSAFHDDVAHAWTKAGVGAASLISIKALPDD